MWLLYGKGSGTLIVVVMGAVMPSKGIASKAKIGRIPRIGMPSKVIFRVSWKLIALDAAES